MSQARIPALVTAITTAAAVVAGGLVTSTVSAAAVSSPGVTAAPRVTAALAAPRVTVAKVVSGLAIPWDVTWVGGVLLFDQRAGGVWSKSGPVPARRVAMALPRIYAHGEAGMLGMVSDPAAATNRMFYTCMAVATTRGAARDVEVWKWQLNPDRIHATKVRTIVSGLPLNTSGRHSGCRLRFRSAHMLYIGTGDAARGTNAQNMQSLGGKILRVRSDGSIPTSNPYYRRGGQARYVWNYGHRNTQGLILRPGTSELWSVEHGTNRDDEVNQVWRSGNYGWNPVPGYNESRPMTDLRRYPHAIQAKWRSGYPTVATSGGTFIAGARWGTWNGVLAVAMLKGQGILLFTLRGDTIVSHRVAFRGYGRIRTVQEGPDGNLYFTTSNGSGDGIYRITPA